MRQRGHCRRLSAIGDWVVGVALAFGLTVVTMAYAVGHISGAHFNPAITIGLWAGRRIPFSDVIPYIVFQVAGAIAAAAVLKIVAQGHPGFVLGDFASNGFGDLSPRSLQSSFLRHHRDPSYLLFRAGNYGGHVGGGPGRFRTARDRPNLDPHSPRRHSGYQRLGQSRAQHRPGDFRGQTLCRFFWAAPISGALVAGIVGGALFRRESG
jgi:aquaporin Z